MTAEATDPPVGTGASGDLVIIALSGVQRFISESRTTADLWGASEIVKTLAEEAATACGPADGVTVVFPALAPSGTSDLAIPNRVVALVAPGTGAQVAERARAAVEARWAGWVNEILGEPTDTPGMPSVQWVSVPADVGAYPVQWELAQQALAARKRVRDHPGPEWTRRRLCSQSPRWPAVQRRPRLARPRDQDQLSAANWVKRCWPRLPEIAADPDDLIGFPSTSSIASAPYRQAVLARIDEPAIRAAVEDLERACRELRTPRERRVPGLVADGRAGGWFADGAGVWVYASSWQADGLRREFGNQLKDGDFDGIAARGHKAATRLLEAMRAGRHAVHPPTPYLALLAQDLDDFGKFLSGALSSRPDGRRVQVSVDEHRSVSKQLADVARSQLESLHSPNLLGRAVYSGGDDLLAFVPAATALAAARGCHDAVPVDLRTPSTAVLFFHRTASLRHAVSEVRRELDEAKAKTARSHKHALAVGFLRRSGVREWSIQPWEPAYDGAEQATAADLFETFVNRGGRGVLSPRLVNELERDAGELADSKLPTDLYHAELARLVARHGGDAGDARALVRLGHQEATSPAGRDRGTPQRAARVAVFLRQECRPYRAPQSTGLREERHGS